MELHLPGDDALELLLGATQADIFWLENDRLLLEGLGSEKRVQLDEHVIAGLQLSQEKPAARSFVE